MKRPASWERVLLLVVALVALLAVLAWSPIGSQIPGLLRDAGEGIALVLIVLIVLVFA